MNDLTPRIRRVTEDLKAVQEQLISATAPGASGVAREAILESLLEENLLFDFKSSVDHMRHLLWTYIETEVNKNEGDVHATLQQVRMQRVTEMLHVLAPTVEEAEMNEHPQAQSFFEIIHQIANTAMDRTMENYKK